MASWHPPKLGFRPRSLTPQALTRQRTPPRLSSLGDLPAPSDLEKAEACLFKPPASRTTSGTMSGAARALKPGSQATRLLARLPLASQQAAPR
jgi:hypothetical protein